VRPVHVATYIEQLGRRDEDPLSAQTIKQQLAAIRQLFDWLVVGQVVPVNPAASVRGPKHVVKTGKTPVLDGKEWRRCPNHSGRIGLFHRPPRCHRLEAIHATTRCGCTSAAAGKRTRSVRGHLEFIEGAQFAGCWITMSPPTQRCAFGSSPILAAVNGKSKP
jgi:hypothetical protein